MADSHQVASAMSQDKRNWKGRLFMQDPTTGKIGFVTSLRTYDSPPDAEGLPEKLLVNHLRHPVPSSLPIFRLEYDKREDKEKYTRFLNSLRGGEDGQGEAKAAEIRVPRGHVYLLPPREHATSSSTLKCAIDYITVRSVLSQAWELHRRQGEEPGAKRAKTQTNDPAAGTQGGRRKKRPLTDVREDYPEVARLRADLIEQCRQGFADKVSSYGPLSGDSKTAATYAAEGMGPALQGIWARYLFDESARESQDAHLSTQSQSSQAPNAEAEAQGTEASGSEEGVGSSTEGSRRVEHSTEGSRRVEQVDPVLPSHAPLNGNVVDELVEAGRTREEALEIYNHLVSSTTTAAKAVRERWTEVHARVVGSQEADGNGQLEGIRVEREEAHELTRLHGQGMTFEINDAHLAKLRLLYDRYAGHDEAFDEETFIRRAFCLLWRYEAVSGLASGYQMALPEEVFASLTEVLGVEGECFASPLNCYYDQFCSMFPDTDQFFGSNGSFFNWRPTSGSFEANPPFVEELMYQMVLHMEDLLSSTDQPLSFTVVMPDWDDEGCRCYQHMLKSKFLRPPGRHIRIAKWRHMYQQGLQHRSNNLLQKAGVDTFILVLQNDPGAAKWPVTDQVLERLTLVSERFYHRDPWKGRDVKPSTVGLRGKDTRPENTYKTRVKETGRGGAAVGEKRDREA